MCEHPDLSQTIPSWVQKAFASLRRTVRSNLALFLPALQYLFASHSNLPRFPKAHPLPLLVDWTPAEGGAHQALVAALPFRGRTLWVTFFELHPLDPWPSRNRVEVQTRSGYVQLFLAQGKREPWYPAFWSPLDWGLRGYLLSDVD